MRHFSTLLFTSFLLLFMQSSWGEIPRSTHSITTSFTAEASADGNMFDVTTFANPITITNIHINASNSLQPVACAVYRKTGTFKTFETEETAWTLVSQTTITPQGLNIPTPVDVTDFVIPAHTTTGMYVTITNTGPGEPQMHYVVGIREFTNDDLLLSPGVGIGGMFGYLIENRTWSGTIEYTLGSAQ